MQGFHKSTDTLVLISLSHKMRNENSLKNSLILWKLFASKLIIVIDIPYLHNLLSYNCRN